VKALLQRVKKAHVSIEDALHSSIGPGVVVLLGVGPEDGPDEAEYLAQRCVNLRIFEDAEGKMNRSVKETGGSMLVVSQFTLMADTRTGNRPSFTGAAPPAIAKELYEQFVARARSELSPDRVATGVFRAMMDIHLINAGPVTVLVESKEG
jgi:D-tyrosyl-tRNA(Tyr) deacylase